MPDDDAIVHLYGLDEEGGMIVERFFDGRVIVRPGEVIGGVLYEELAAHCAGRLARSWFSDPEWRWE